MIPGTVIVIPRGYGYNTHDPIAFRRSDGTVRATIYRCEGQRVWFTLSNGQTADTRVDCVRAVEE